MTTRAAVPPFQTFLEKHRSIVYRFLRASVGVEDLGLAADLAVRVPHRGYVRHRQRPPVAGAPGVDDLARRDG